MARRKFFFYPETPPKIIQGTLELMPAGPPWDAREYEEWLALFDKACRIYYRIEGEVVPVVGSE